MSSLRRFFTELWNSKGHGESFVKGRILDRLTVLQRVTRGMMEIIVREINVSKMQNKWGRKPKKLKSEKRQPKLQLVAFFVLLSNSRVSQVKRSERMENGYQAPMLYP